MDWDDYKIIIRDRKAGTTETHYKAFKREEPGCDTWHAVFNYARDLAYCRNNTELVKIELLEKEG